LEGRNSCHQWPIGGSYHDYRHAGDNEQKNNRQPAIPAISMDPRMDLHRDHANGRPGGRSLTSCFNDSGRTTPFGVNRVREVFIRFLIGGLFVSAFAVLGDGLKPKSFAGLFGAAPSVAFLGLVGESARACSSVSFDSLAVCGAASSHAIADDTEPWRAHFVLNIKNRRRSNMSTIEKP
jgi:hypothetical protein